MTTEGFNKKIFRGAKLLRVGEKIKSSLDTLREQKSFNEREENISAIHYIDGQIEGLERALKLLIDEFED